MYFNLTLPIITLASGSSVLIFTAASSQIGTSRLEYLDIEVGWSIPRYRSRLEYLDIGVGWNIPRYRSRLEYLDIRIGWIIPRYRSRLDYT